MDQQAKLSVVYGARGKEQREEERVWRNGKLHSFLANLNMDLRSIELV